MINHELNPYKRLSNRKPRQLLQQLRQTDPFELAEYAILLLLGRATIFGTINPFLLAFYAATFPKQKRVFGIAVACAASLLGGFGVQALKYVGSVAIISAFSLLFPEALEKRRWLTALITALSLAANGMIYVYFDGMLLYDLLQLGLEVTCTVLCYFSFRRFRELLRNLTARRVLENEETLSLVLLTSAILLSFSGLPYLGGAAHILSALIVMIFSLTGGVAVSVMSGTMLGFVLSTADIMPAQVIGVYALCALVSGLLRRYGKWGVSIGFFLTNAASMLYFNSSTVTIITYYYILLAAFILFLLPESFLNLFGSVARTPGFHPFEDPVEKTKAVLDEKLSESEKTFSELSDVFQSLIRDKVYTDLQDAAQVFEKTADKVCVHCSMKRFCWQKNRRRTTDTLMGILPLMQERGRAADIDFSPQFRENCLHFDVFLQTLNRCYDVYRINFSWSARVLESRQLVAEQFRNISSVLAGIRQRMRSDIVQDMQMENRIDAALDRKGILAEQISVGKKDGYEVNLRVNCVEQAENDKILDAVSEALEVPVMQVNCEATQKHGETTEQTVQQLYFREQERFRAEVGSAQTARDQMKCSGDHHIFSLLGDGTYVMALSDGMGSGEAASAQSAAAIDLMKRLLHAGFDKETTIRLINSVLLTAAEDDIFATIDLCLIHLYTGALEFIKVGAANSYHKSADEVSCISSSSLPIGIVNRTEPDCALRYAKSGDYIVLMSDGVSEILENEREHRASEMMRAYCGNSAQELADALLLEAVRLSGGRIRDDMTVLCARISENAA